MTYTARYGLGQGWVKVKFRVKARVSLMVRLIHGCRHQRPLSLADVKRFHPFAHRLLLLLCDLLCHGLPLGTPGYG